MSEQPVTVEVDFAPLGDESIEEALATMIGDLDLTTSDLVERGPAGGNPCVHLHGEYAEVRRFLVRHEYDLDAYEMA